MFSSPWRENSECNVMVTEMIKDCALVASSLVDGK
jgi:hypothetical protein